MSISINLSYYVFILYNTNCVLIRFWVSSCDNCRTIFSITQIGGSSNTSVYDNERLFVITLINHNNFGLRVWSHNNNGLNAFIVNNSIGVCFVSVWRNSNSGSNGSNVLAGYFFGANVGLTAFAVVVFVTNHYSRRRFRVCLNAE